MIALPLWFGQLLGGRQSGGFDWLQFGLLTGFGVLLQAYILYLNDFADERSDRLNEDYFLSGGSRVIPSGQLTGKQLLRGALVALALLMALGAVHSLVFARLDAWLAYALAALLGWAYSLPPASASYRGWGELLQAFSCGVVLPVLGYHAQTGTLADMPWASLLPVALLFYASNIVTALPDVAADGQCNRRTYPIRRGEHAARRDVGLLLLAATAASMATALDDAHLAALGAVNLPVLLLLWRVYRSDVHAIGAPGTRGRHHAFVGAIAKLQAALLLGWVVALPVAIRIALARGGL